MTNIIILIVTVFLASYGIGYWSGRKNPGKDAAKLTAILGVAIVILAGIVYVSIVT